MIQEAGRKHLEKNELANALHAGKSEAATWYFHNLAHEKEPYSHDWAKNYYRFRKARIRRDAFLFGVDEEKIVPAIDILMGAVQFHDVVEFHHLNGRAEMWKPAEYALEEYFRCLNHARGITSERTTNEQAKLELLRWYAHHTRNYKGFSHFTAQQYQSQFGFLPSEECTEAFSQASMTHDRAERVSDPFQSRQLWMQVTRSLQNHYVLLRNEINHFNRGKGVLTI